VNAQVLYNLTVTPAVDLVAEFECSPAVYQPHFVLLCGSGQVSTGQPISSFPVSAPLCYMQGCGVLIWVGQLRVLTLAFIGTPVVGDHPDTKVRKTTDISQF